LEDRFRLNRIGQLLVQIDQLGWFVDIHEEEPGPAVETVIRRQFDRICETAKAAEEGWSDFEDHPRLSDQERKNRIGLFGLLQKVMLQLNPLGILNPKIPVGQDGVELIVERYAPVRKSMAAELREAWEINSKSLREEHQFLQQHAVAVRKSIARMTAI
jgi:hypothetical protein